MYTNIATQKTIKYIKMFNACTQAVKYSENAFIPHYVMAFGQLDCNQLKVLAS